MEHSNIIIIGGGIVGLATAYQIHKHFPDQSITLLEKEDRVAEHQTGHNSGVLHSGIYYKPGSLKAINCRQGKIAMEQFCEQYGIEYELCGKVIVALSDSEIPSLEKIYDRGQQNGVRCEMIDAARLKELEPYAAGVRAIHVPESGIVNYRQVCEKMAALIQQGDNRVITGARVTKIEHRGEESIVTTPIGEYKTNLIINCAGLHCDRITRMGGQNPEAKIVPFRGEYYELKPEAKKFCRNLIYPVPDPKFPFLGVHFTRMVGGAVECGPNAVLAFAREGYGKTQINFGDLFESLTYPGFLRMATRHWSMGAGEMWRSFNKNAFVRALQRLIPEIQANHLEPAPAGIRAQAVSPDGTLVDDFLIKENQRMVNVLNAPSPAATASLNIGLSITQRLEQRLGTPAIAF